MTSNWPLYSLLDAAVTMQAWREIEGDLKADGFQPAYEQTMALLEPMLYATTRGIKVDLAALARENKKITDETIPALENELARLCGFELNYNSPKRCQEYFYGLRGIKPYVSRTTGNITVDDKALTRMAIKGIQEASVIQELRYYGKLKSTYYDVVIDPDGRLRCSWNLRGTKFGRLSSSATLFGTGLNLQNLHPAFLDFLVPDDNCCFIEWDKVQAEWVVTAYVSGDYKMIEAIESGQDVHAVTGSLITGLPIDLILEDHKLVKNETNDLKIRELRKSLDLTAARILPRTMSIRQCGKKCLTGDAEVLSNQGWIKLSNLDPDNQLIAQWRDGIVEFVKPIAMYQDTYNGSMVELESNHIHQLVTPDHRIPVAHDRHEIYSAVTASDLDTNITHRHIPVSGVLSVKPTLHFTIDEIKLLVAIQADGSIDSYDNLILRVDKPFKVCNADGILSRLGLRYTRTSRGYFIHNSNPICRVISIALGRRKMFGPWLLSLPIEVLHEFLWELPRWDGYAAKGQYFTTVKENAEWVQTIAHLTKCRATIKKRDPSGFGKKPLYWVKLNNRYNSSLVSIKKTYSTFTGEIYCLSVPSSYFLVRYNGKISITGNSNHGLNYDEGPVRFSLENDLDQREGTRIHHLYHESYMGLQRMYAAVQSDLAVSRSLTNCFGRKCTFYDRWDRELFKAAYAFKPQSTVADVVNRGIIASYHDVAKEMRPLEILAQKHDSITGQYPLGNWKNIAKCVLMVCNHIDPVMSYNNRSFRIKTSVKIGRSGSRMGEIKLTKNISELASRLEKAYGSLAK